MPAGSGNANAKHAECRTADVSFSLIHAPDIDIYEKIFEKDGVRGVLIALETDHGEEFLDVNTALAAARESFSDLECEDVTYAVFFRSA
jgi:hypothetical protein